jgi:hypothetical protein
MRGAQNNRMNLPREVQIGDVAAAAGYKPVILLSANGLADAHRTHFHTPFLTGIFPRSIRFRPANRSSCRAFGVDRTQIAR